MYKQTKQNFARLTVFTFMLVVFIFMLVVFIFHVVFTYTTYSIQINKLGEGCL